MDAPQTKKSQQNKFKGNPRNELHTGKGTRAIEHRQELAAKRVTIIKKI